MIQLVQTLKLRGLLAKNELSKDVVCRKHMLTNPEMRFPIIHNSRNKMQSSTDLSSADANLKNAKLGVPGGGGQSKRSKKKLAPKKPGRGPQTRKNGEQLLFSLLSEIAF